MRQFILASGTAAALCLCAPAVAQDNVLRGPVPDWVSPSEPLAVPADAAGMIFVRRQDTFVRLHDEGQTTYLGQHFRILNTQALAAGNLALTWNPAVGAPTVHAVRVHRGDKVVDVLDSTDFTILRREEQLEQAMLDGMLTATLRVPDLRVGDELEVEYSQPSHDPTLGDRNFGILIIADAPPEGRYNLGVEWVDGQRPRTQPSAAAAPILATQKSGLALRADNPAPYAPPRDAPSRYAWTRILEFSDFADWQDVSRTFHPLYVEASRVAPGSAIADLAAEIAAEHSNDTDRMAAALALVQEQVRYIYVGLNGGNLRPASATETWERRYGDCKGKTALLMALLGELGIEAEAVLANNSGFDDGLDQRLASPGMFDHVLVRARAGGKTYWLDGTLPKVATASERPILPYRFVLPLAAKGAGLDAIAWQPQALPDEMGFFFIDASAGFDEPAKQRQVTVRRGIEGLVQYAQLAGVSPAQLDQGLRGEFIGSGDWSAIETIRYQYDEATQASILTVVGEGPADWDGSGDFRSMTLPGGGFNPPARKQRESSQDQTAPYAVEPGYSCYVTSVRFPDETAVEDWTHNDGFFTSLLGRSFHRQFELVDDRTLRMVRASRAEQPEIAAAKAAADNGQIASFDNSMAQLEYDKGMDWDQAIPKGEASLPLADAAIWLTSDAPCMPAPIVRTGGAD